MNLYARAFPRWRAFIRLRKTAYVVRRLAGGKSRGLYQVGVHAVTTIGSHIFSSCSAPVPTIRECKQIIAMQHGVRREEIILRRAR